MFNRDILTNFPQKAFLSLSLAGAIITIDQLLKYKIRHSGGFYICNQGISFNVALPVFLFWLIFALFFLFGLIYIHYSIKRGTFFTFTLISLTFIMSGAIANGLDRFFFNCVTDFFSINLIPFPFFNLADVSIFLGSFLFILTLRSKK